MPRLLSRTACFAPLPSALTHLAPPDERGRYMGGYGMMWGTAHCLAPIVGTSVLQAFGSVTLWSGCFAVCAAAAIAHVLIAPGRAGPQAV